MKTIEVTIGEQGLALADAYELLAGMPGIYERATKYALKDTLRHVESRSSAEIVKKYDIKKQILQNHVKLSEKYSYRLANVDATLEFYGSKIGLYHFSGSPQMPPRLNRKVSVNLADGSEHYMQPSAPAKGHQLKGSSYKELDGTFIGKVKAGDGITDHYGFFRRLDRDKHWWKPEEAIWSEGPKAGTRKTPSVTHKIEEVYGSAVPQMVDNEDVKELLRESAAAKFEDRFAHYVELGRQGFAWWKKKK